MFVILCYDMVQYTLICRGVLVGAQELVPPGGPVPMRVGREASGG